MNKLSRSLFLPASLTAIVTTSALANDAFWSFDTWRSGDGQFTKAVTAHSMNDAPSLDYEGTTLVNSGGAESFISYNGTEWRGSGKAEPPGHSLGWTSGSKNNSFSVKFGTEHASSLQIQMDIRQYGMSGQTFVKLEYDAGAGFTEANISLPSFPDQGNFNTWSIDLSQIKELFGKPAVTLRWLISDAPANGSIRIDNLQLSLN